MSDPARVFVVDDDRGMRDSLRFLLESAGFAVETYASARAFLDAGGAGKSGCLLTDVRMPEMNGLELQEKLAAESSRLSVILMTGHADVPMAVQAMKAGAIDFIEKPFAEDVLFEAVARATGELQKRPKGEDDLAAIRQRLALLSDRERQVLTGLVAGLPNKTIGYDLEISPRTVEVHRANVMAKMQARSLPELVRMVIATEA